MVRTPFDDAIAVWHLGHLRNGNGAAHSSSEVRSAHPLATHGSVQVGVPLADAERRESLLRGGDGRAALFDGDAWLSTGPATGGVDLSPRAFTACVRLRADRPGGVFYTNLFALLMERAMATTRARGCWSLTWGCAQASRPSTEKCSSARSD